MKKLLYILILIYISSSVMAADGIFTNIRSSGSTTLNNLTVTGYMTGPWVSPQKYGMLEGTGKSTEVRIANAVALQAAVNYAQSIGLCVQMPQGNFEYSSTLLADDDFCIRGTGASIRGEKTWLIYTGIGHGIKSIDNTRRTWRWHIFNLNLKATNLANTGHGIFMETVNAPVVENVYILGFGGWGMYITSATGLGGVDSGKISKVHVIYSSNGIYANGVSGSMVVDYVFDSCIAQELRNPDESSSNGYSFYSGQYTARNRWTDCTYKQSGSLVLTDATYDNGTYNIWKGLSGEVNQNINEIHVGPNASYITYSACFLQSRTRITDEGSHTIWMIAQRPITQHELSAFNFQVFSFSVTGITNTATLVQMTTASTGTATFSPQIFPGSVVAVSISRQSGNPVTAGYVRAWPTKNDAEVNASFYGNYISTSETTSFSYTTRPKTSFPFVVGDKIGCSYKSSFSGGGPEATFVCEVWVTRDSVEVTTIGP